MSETEPKTLQETDGPACSCAGPKCKLWIPLLIILVLVIAGFIVTKSNFWKIYRSDPYSKTLQTVQANSDIQAKLGKPVKASGWPTGNLTDKECKLFFDVVGPNGKGKVVVEGRTSDKGVWSFHKVEVTFDEGEPIQVQMEKQEGELEEAPPFNAPGGNNEPANNPAGDPANNPGGQP